MLNQELHCKADNGKILIIWRILVFRRNFCFFCFMVCQRVTLNNWRTFLANQCRFTIFDLPDQGSICRTFLKEHWDLRFFFFVRHCTICDEEGLWTIRVNWRNYNEGRWKFIIFTLANRRTIFVDYCADRWSCIRDRATILVNWRGSSLVVKGTFLSPFDVVLKDKYSMYLILQ